MSKILITGASGFVGSFLVEEALRQNLEVYAGIRSSSSRKWLQDDRIRMIEMDLSDTNALKKCMYEYQFDYVLHNAGLTKAKSTSELFTVNAEFTQNLAKSSIHPNLKKFTFISSLAAYGPADYQPDKVLSVHSQPHPVTTYGHSKLKAEGYLRKIDQLPYLILRPTGVFGPRESDFFKLFQSINRGIAPQIGMTDQWLSLIYVRDLAYIVIKATISDVSRRDYFLTDGNLYPGSKLIDTIAVSLNKNPVKLRIPLPIVYTIAAVNEAWSRLSGNATILNIDKYAEIKARNLDCDISDVVADFDFIPKYTLQEAIKETAQWYKQQRWL